MATKMYVCGPTVYDHSHIGHARTYIIVDLIYRITKNPYLVMNITDIDDKIINKAQTLNVPWQDIAKKYEDSFFDSMRQLNVQTPNTIIRVSEVIPNIIAYIQKIIDNGFAYLVKDGSVYFDTDAYKNAGYDYAYNEEEVEHELFPLQSGEISEYEQNGIRNTRKSARDFALWKGRNKEEVGFDAYFSIPDLLILCYGRPGWHIECSTMIHETLGHHFDVHYGGIDLKFPHHYNETVQANAFHHPKYLSTDSWCDDFQHVGHLCIDGLKMSKSLKNFTTIHEILEKVNPNCLRWLFMKHKWTDPMNYNDETLNEAKLIDDSVFHLQKRISGFPFQRRDIVYRQKEEELQKIFEQIQISVENCLPKFEFDLFVSEIQRLIKKINIYLGQPCPNQTLTKKCFEWIELQLRQLGFQYEQETKVDIGIEPLMAHVIQQRTSLRGLTRISEINKTNLFEILDQQRKELSNLGITLQDTKDNSLWFRNA
jgi:cysteinyl-tRNA synthetase